MGIAAAVRDVAAAYASGKVPPIQKTSAVLETDQPVDSLSERIGVYQSLLALSLLQELAFRSQRPFEEALCKAIHRATRTPLSRRAQLDKAYLTFLCQRHQIPFQNESLYQLPSGAIPYEKPPTTWSWAAAPQHLPHVQAATLWALTGAVESAHRAAKWLTGLLACDQRPLLGLFSRAGDATQTEQLLWNRALFLALAHLGGGGEWISLAEGQRALLRDEAIGEGSGVRELVPQLVAEWLIVNGSAPESGQVFLQEGVEDEYTIFAASREAGRAAAGTLTGGAAGLGTFYVGDVEVVTFGPQSLPLDCCSLFGLRGDPPEGAWIDTGAHTFALGGRVAFNGPALKGHHPVYYEGVGQRGVWADIEIRYRQKRLELSSLFSSVYPLDEFAMVFYVRSTCCSLSDGREIRRGELQGYRGPIQSVSLVGKEAQVSLSASQEKGSLQVIPLGDGNRCWGADFLVAYVLDSLQTAYSWGLH